MECVPKNEIKNHTAYKGLLESIGECEGRSIWQVNCGQFNASIGSRPLLRVNKIFLVGGMVGPPGLEPGTKGL